MRKMNSYHANFLYSSLAKVGVGGHNTLEIFLELNTTTTSFIFLFPMESLDRNEGMTIKKAYISNATGKKLNWVGIILQHGKFQYH